MTPSEKISAGLAFLSLIAGIFAAIAAFKSAKSAAEMQTMANDIERRAVLRQIAMTATEVVIEAGRIAQRGIHLRMLYSTLAVFSGGVGGSRNELYDKAVQEKVSAANKLADHAKLFVNSGATLVAAPESEIDRVHVELSTALLKIQAIHIDMEREISDMASQVGDFRRRNLGS